MLPLHALAFSQWPLVLQNCGTPLAEQRVGVA
jgi:hypothetical protein